MIASINLFEPPWAGAQLAFCSAKRYAVCCGVKRKEKRSCYYARHVVFLFLVFSFRAYAQDLKLHINAGINDGHTGSVPISHSLLAFNEVAATEDRLSQEEINFFVEKADVPPHLKVELSDSSYGRKHPLFRRQSGNATVTIFQGGHELVASAAVAWFEEVYNACKGLGKSDDGDD